MIVLKSLIFIAEVWGYPLTTPEILENCSKEMLENEYMEESFTG